MSGTQKVTNNSPAKKSGPSERQRLKKIIMSVLLDRPDSETRLKKPSTSSAADEETTPAGAQLMTPGNKQTDVSTTKSTLILSGSFPNTRGSWPIYDTNTSAFILKSLKLIHSVIFRQ